MLEISSKATICDSVNISMSFSDVRYVVRLVCIKGVYLLRAEIMQQGEKQCPGIIKAVADRGAIMAAVVAQALRGKRNRGPRRRATPRY